MPSSTPPPGSRPRTRRVVAVLACALVCAWSAAPGGAASSTTIVDVSIPTVTIVDATGCQPGVVGRTDFGIVQPGSSAVSTSDCRLVLSSNASTSQLLVTQTDGLLAPMFQPARGPLDPLFDPGGAEGSGKALADLGATDQVRYLETMADGRIVVGGRAGPNFAAARFMPDGSLDASFSPGGAEGDGRGVYPTSGGDNAFGMALQPDGKVLLSGSTSVATDDILVMRLTTTGALDPLFAPGGTDGNGVLTITRGGTDEQAYGLEVDAAGDIYITSLTTGTSDITVTRLNTDGTIDTAFAPGGADGDGVLTIDTGSTEYAYATAIAADGDLLIAAQRAGLDIVVARVTPAGILDATFAPGGADGDGIVTFGAAEHEAPRGIAETADGSIIVSGYATLGSDDARVWKLTPNGVLDSTFGVGGTDGDGVVTVDFTGGTDVMRTVRVQPDGKLVTAGNSHNGTDADVALLRLLPDGTPDPGFASSGAGGDGRVRIDFGGSEANYGLDITDDGALVTGGSASGNFAVTRLGSDIVANYAGTWATGDNTFGACLVDVSVGTAQWNEVGAGNCSTSTAAAWNPVPADTSGGIADVVSFGSPFTNATVDLRFGMRAAMAQPPGDYVAPITFSFVAP